LAFASLVKIGAGKLVLF